MYSSEARNLYSRATTDRETSGRVSVVDKPLMILRVEDKYGVVHILKYYRQDDPVTMAQSFGLSHSLDQTAISNLARSMQSALVASASKRSMSKANDDCYNQKTSKITNALQFSRPTSNMAGASQGQENLLRSYFTNKALDSLNDDLEINNGEKKYIVGKRRTEVEMYFFH